MTGIIVFTPEQYKEHIKAYMVEVATLAASIALKEQNQNRDYLKKDAAAGHLLCIKINSLKRLCVIFGELLLSTSA